MYGWVSLLKKNKTKQIVINQLLTQKRVYIFIVFLYIFVLNEQLEVKNLGSFWVLWSVQSFCPAND